MMRSPVIATFALGLAACSGSDGTEAAQQPAAADQESSVASAPANAADGTSSFETVPLPPPPESLTMKAVADLGQTGTGLHPMLRGGRIAKSGDWPASLLARFEVAPGRFASCTAALVGPSAMLTAAHCVPTSGVVGFTYNGRNYRTSCTRHPQYVDRSDPSADYALCKLEAPFQQPNGFRFESIRTAAFDPLAGQDVMLTGYGCISDDANNQQMDGFYRYGFNRIDETSASKTQNRGARYYSGSEDNNLLTEDSGANVCPGDSGGPAFLRTAGTDEEAVSNRVIVAVNSRVFFRDAARTTFGSSLLSATGGPDFKSWAQNWASSNNVAACGLTAATIPNCRS